jgi:hypothetical protein
MAVDKYHDGKAVSFETGATKIVKKKNCQL